MMNRNRLVLIGAAGGLGLLLLMSLVLGIGPLQGLATTPAAASPLVGDQGNTNPVLGTVKSWQDLLAAGNSQPWYQQCLASRNGTTWAQVQQYAAQEKAGGVFDQVVIVENSSMSDSAAFVALQAAGYNLPADVPIKRITTLDNTRSLTSQGCSRWKDDSRSQVRVALAAPQTTEAAVAEENLLVLEMCGNPLGIPTRSSPSTPPAPHQTTCCTSTPTPTPSPSSTPCGKCNTPTPKPSPGPSPRPSPSPSPSCAANQTFTSAGCLDKKDPTQDPLVNPSVPPAVKGTGTTPVGTSPGPATSPTDSPTGCNGLCPQPSSAPSAPPTPVPQPSSAPTPPSITPVTNQPPASGTPAPPPSS